MDELLTSKQVQEYLKVDRTTIYRMLKDGRLTGVKVGQQWRFLRQEVEALLSGFTLSSQDEQSIISTNVLPLYCIQVVQDVFAEMAQVGAVVTALDGEPLTEVSNSYAFCKQVLASESGRQACINSWRKLAKQTGPQPQFVTCHAGLQYARARIEVNSQFIAMLIAGQFYAHPPDSEEEKGRIAQLAQTHDLDPQELAAASQELPVLDKRIRTQISRWLERVGYTFAQVGRERADMMSRLQRIADISALANPQ
jgi:excisionase family DNA binding protein